MDIFLGYNIFDTHDYITQNVEQCDDIEPIGSFFDIIQKDYEKISSPDVTINSTDDSIIELDQDLAYDPLHYLAGEYSSESSEIFDYEDDDSLQYGEKLSESKSQGRLTFTAIINEIDMNESMEVEQHDKQGKITFNEESTEEDSDDLAEKASQYFHENYTPVDINFSALLD